MTDSTTTAPEPAAHFGGAGLDLPSLNLMLEALNDFVDAALSPDLQLELDAEDRCPEDIVRAMSDPMTLGDLQFAIMRILWSRGAVSVADVHEALLALEAAEPRLAMVVEMRYFGGYSEAEIAETLETTAVDGSRLTGEDRAVPVLHELCEPAHVVSSSASGGLQPPGSARSRCVARLSHEEVPCRRLSTGGRSRWKWSRQGAGSGRVRERRSAFTHTQRISGFTSQ